jgi:hypothetical protein
MVTYMPRDAGGWNADTIQQRARFFGYKAAYLSLCRLYLHPDVTRAYRAYVRHEDDVRRQLAAHRGRPLREWRRAFFLDAKLRPTRQNVLSDPYYRIRADRPWFVQEQPHVDPDAAARNSSLLERLLAANPRSGDPRYYDHTVCELSLSALFRDVLLTFEVRGLDRPSWYGHLVMLRDVLEADPSARVLLMEMAGERKRGVTDGEVKLHQGRSSAQGGDRYPGDAKMCAAEMVTVQVHHLRVEAASVSAIVPALAVHIPAALRRDDVMVQAG